MFYYIARVGDERVEEIPVVPLPLVIDLIRFITIERWIRKCWSFKDGMMNVVVHCD